MENTGTLRIRPFKKLPKSEFFISFNMEFRLKTSENHLKSSSFTIKILGHYELVLFIPSKIHEK
jgi:hypothetical protein